MNDVVVIGGGVGGLAAAIRAASRGLRVTLVEAGTRLGGKAGWETVDGVEFDTGPSVVTLIDVLDDVFRAAGTRLEEQVRLVRPDPAFTYRWPDGVCLPIRPDPEDTAEAIRAVLGAEAAEDFRGFLAYAAGIWEVAGPRFVMRPAPTLGQMASWQALRELPAIDPLRSMAGALRARVRSPHLRSLFARYATYNGSDPRAAPAALNCIAHVELAMGCYGVEGGVAELVRAMVRVAEGLGVMLITGAPARRIRVRSGRVEGVETDAGLLAARAVVVNADVAHLVAELLPEVPSSLSRTDPPSLSGWTAVLRARVRPDRAAHEVLFSADPAAEVERLFDQGLPPEEPTVYLCSQRLAHHRSTWGETEPLFVMANAPALGADRRERPDWEALADRTLGRLREAGLVDPADAVVWTRTPGGLAERFPGTGGALYGASSNSRFAAFRRPPNRVAGLGGLYLASGSAHPGGGVPLCARSGTLAAEALVADLGGRP